MKRVIVPTDFSELSIKGLELALLLANKMNADIELVHVINPDENNLSLGEEKVRRANIQQSFTDIFDMFKQQYPHILISNIVKEGKIHEEVINQAEAFSDSLIVTSTHGASGWEEFFTGSNAYKIAASSTKPVFTIRGKTVPSQIKNIVLPLDNTPETREKVPLTAELAALFGASVSIVTLSTFDMEDVLSKLEDYALQVGKYLERFGIESTIEHLTGTNYTDITIEFAKKNKADLISVMTEQEKSITNLLLGNYAHQMINKSPVPVLLFPTKQIGINSESFKTQGINY